jgi:Siphovirus Gp157
MSISFYDMADEYLTSFCEMEEDGFDAETIDDTLAGLKGDLEKKAVNCIAYSKHLDAEAEALKNLIDGATKRRNALLKTSERIKDYVKENMEMVGLSKIRHTWFALAIQRNPPSLGDIDEKLIPSDYWNVPDPPKPTVNRGKVLSALKAGTEVPGASLVQKTRLVVK